MRQVLVEILILFGGNLFRVAQPECIGAIDAIEFRLFCFRVLFGELDRVADVVGIALDQ